MSRYRFWSKTLWIIKVTDETNSFYGAIKNLKNSTKVNEENRKKLKQKSKVLNYVRLLTDFEVDAMKRSLTNLLIWVATK